MKILTALPLAAVLVLPLAAHAEDGVPTAKLNVFDAKVFGGPIEKEPLPASSAATMRAIWRSIRSRRSAR